MFKSIDTDDSGTITFEELKAGLTKMGTKLSESEVRQLMDAVFSWPFLISWLLFPLFSSYLLLAIIRHVHFTNLASSGSLVEM